MSTSDSVTNRTTRMSNNFKLDPPNAVLVIRDNQNDTLDIIIIELFNPMFDETLKILTYSINPLDDISFESREIGQSVLIIDHATPGDHTFHDNTFGKLSD